MVFLLKSYADSIPSCDSVGDPAKNISKPSWRNIHNVMGCPIGNGFVFCQAIIRISYSIKNNKKRMTPPCKYRAIQRNRLQAEILLTAGFDVLGLEVYTHRLV